MLIPIYSSLRNYFFDIKVNLREGMYHGSAALFDRITFFLIFSAAGKILGDSALGSLAAALSICNILLMASDFGLSVLIQRETSKNNFSPNDLSTSLIIKLVAAIVGLSFVYLYATSTGIITFTFAFLIYLSMLMFSLSNVFMSVFLGSNLNSLYLKIVVISRFIMLLFLSLLIIFPLLEILVIAFFLGGSSQILMAYRKLEINFSSPYFYLNSVKKVFKSSVSIWLGMLFVYAYDKIDILILASFRSSAESGEYYAAYSIMKSFTILTSFYLVKYFTNLAGNYKKNKAHFVSSVIQSLFLSTLVGLLIILFISALAEEIVQILFSKAFENSAALLKILIWTAIIMIWNYNLGTILNSMDKENVPMLGAAAAFCINLILNLHFIPIYGATAAAYITILTEAVMFLFLTTGFIITIRKSANG